MADLSIAGAKAAVPHVPVTHGAYPPGKRGLEVSLDTVGERIRQGRLDPRVRSWAIRTLKDAGSPKTQFDQAQALLDGQRKAAIYVSDPVNAEYIQAAHETLCLDDKGYCFKGGDCFPQGTLILRQGTGDDSSNVNVPIEEIKVGDKIWGLNEWSIVEAVADKGVLPVTQIFLFGRGKPIELTKDHHVYVEYDGMLERVRVRDLLSGQRLAVPNKSKMRRDADPRVEVLVQDKYETHCFDIQTSDHYVYLPEHDVTVSNCDDLSVALGSALMSIGIPTIVIGQAFQNSDVPQHVLVGIVDTKNDITYRIDPSSDTFAVGQSYPGVTREWRIDPLKTMNTKLDGVGLDNGDIVGVGRVPHGLGAVDTSTVIPENDAIYQATTSQLKIATFALQKSVADLTAALNEIENTRNILRPNMPYDPEPTNPITSLANFPAGGVWTKSMSNLAHDMLHTGQQVANALQDGLNGTRKTYIDLATKEAYIESLPHDSVRYQIIKQGVTDSIVGVFSGSTGLLLAGFTALLGAILTPNDIEQQQTGVQGAPTTSARQGHTGVGAVQLVEVALVAGAVVIASIAVAYIIKRLCDIGEVKAREATKGTILGMVASGKLTEQQGHDLLDADSRNRVAEQEAQAKANASDPFASTAKSIGNVVMWVVIGGAAAAGIYAAAPLLRGGAEKLAHHPEKLPA